MFKNVSLRIALAAFLLAAGWDWTAVHTAYGGNWTGLFYAGSSFTRPAEVAAGEYVFANSAGYDGQFYQLIERDPLFERHYDRYVDAPRVRYRRILLPALGSVAPDEAYFLATWSFVALGAYCLGELTSPLWGLLFLVMPATLVGLDRMTVDVSLTALTLAAILAARRERWWLLWITLAAALLSKETGVLVIAGIVLWLGAQRRFRLATLISTSVFPALIWYAFVETHTRGDYAISNLRFLTPFLAILWRPLPGGPVFLLLRVTGILAVIGMLWACVEGVALGVMNRLRDPALAICLLFGLFALLFEDASIWEDPYSFARVYSPLLAALLAGGWHRRRLLIPFALTIPPVGMQLAGSTISLWIHR